MSNFETWWEREGQEFLYALNTTTDDDIKLVAEIAWKNGAYCAVQAEQEPVACIVRDCCEAEKADPDHSDTICIAVDDLTEIVTHHTTAPVQQAEQEQEPVAWRDHVEQRLLTWRQSFVNRSGDQLALDDFMDKQSLDDLIDFVCDEYSDPKPEHDYKRLYEVAAEKYNALSELMEKKSEQEPVMITPGGGAFPFAVVGEMEQAEQKPMAWGMKSSNGAFFTITPEEHDNNGEGLHNIPLYAAPVQSVSAKPLCWAHWKSPDYAEDPAFLVTTTEKPTGWQTQSANWFPLYAAPVRKKT